VFAVLFQVAADDGLLLQFTRISQIVDKLNTKYFRLLTEVQLVYIMPFILFGVSGRIIT